MASNERGDWIGYGPGDVAAQVAKIEGRLLRAYPKASRAVEVGVLEDSRYTVETAAAVENFQRYVNTHDTPPPKLRTDGIADYATQKRIGAVATLTPPAPSKRFIQQGVGYPAMGFLQPDPNISYVESRDSGVAELLRLMLATPGNKVLYGYSQGADVVIRALLRWPEARRGEIRLIGTFGSPCRPEGPTLLGGRTPKGAGIAGVYTPEWARDREYSFTIDGDMYSESVGVLPQLYDILTRLDLSIEFAQYLFGMLTSSFGPVLLGTVSALVPGAGALAPVLGMVTSGPQSQTAGSVNLMAILFNIPGIVQAIIAALKFVFTQAHSHYHDQPLFDGLTAVDRLAQITAAQVDRATVYTVAGTWAGWNDGPPAWTAWKLP